MKIIGQRLRTLREGIKLSQAKLAKLIDTTQANINKYESGKSTPPTETFLWYADYFDVSLDYIYGRTDKPQGKLYEFKPIFNEDNEELKKFIEMCFDPTSSMNDRLKQALINMVEEAKK